MWYYIIPGLLWSVGITIYAAVLEQVFTPFNVKTALRCGVGLVFQTTFWPLGIGWFIYCRVTKKPFALTMFNW